MTQSELQGLIKGEISSSEEDLKKASTDASIFEVRPELVVKPASPDDVKALVKFVASHKAAEPGLSLTARSAGTDMSGGPLNESVIVDFTAHFNKVLEVGDGYAVTEPGVYYRDFEEETLKSGQIMPSYPASRELCTVGGMVNNNAGGEKSLSYGKTEQFVEELNVVLANGEEYVFHALTPRELEQKKKGKTFEGEVYRRMHDLLEKHYDTIHAAKPNVTKNSAGYFIWNVWDRQRFDLCRLFTGAQGTLGFVTKIKFRLVKKKNHSSMVVMFLNDLEVLGDLVPAVLKFKPETFESFDDKTFKLAMKFFPDLLKRMKGGLFSLGFRFLPEVWMTLTGGVPKLVLIAEFTGDSDEEARAHSVALEAAIRRFKVKTHITKDTAEAAKYWVMRRESFSLLRQHVQGMHTAPFIDDFVVRPEFLPEFLPQLHGIMEPYLDRMVYTIAGHAGDGNFHIIPLMDFKRPESRAAIPELSEKVYDLVKKYHGSITGEHNDGLVRTPYLLKMYGPEITALFREVKDIFDPLRILNPHKKVDGKLEYITRYMKKE